MSQYTPTELAEILELHRLWIIADPKGKRADLSDADLSGADLRGADLSRAILRGADLIRADLRGAYLSDADLSSADLSGADLTRAYLTGAKVPVVECIDQRILELVEANPRCFDMSQWHSDCGTTHCRAGWAVVLAGDAGQKLEEKIGTNAAGALIYAKSCPTLPVPNFFASDSDALEDMRSRAGKGC